MPDVIAEMPDIIAVDSVAELQDIDGNEGDDYEYAIFAQGVTFVTSLVTGV